MMVVVIARGVSMRCMTRMRRVMIVRRLGAGESGASADDGDDGGQDRAEQRQEDDRLVHS